MVEPRGDDDQLDCPEMLCRWIIYSSRYSANTSQQRLTIDRFFIQYNHYHYDDDGGGDDDGGDDDVIMMIYLDNCKWVGGWWGR